MHIACKFRTIGVVKFVAETLKDSLDVLGLGNNNPLHYACRGGKCETVKYLSEKRPAVVSERNEDGDLPLHLLCLHGAETGENESLEYIEAVWCLLRTYPEIALSFN